jgi:sugar/nucleoside kinase (ribokinase family)
MMENIMTKTVKKNVVRGFAQLPEVMDIGTGQVAAMDVAPVTLPVQRDTLIADAMQSIATFFTDEREYQKRDGEITKYNALRYTRDVVLSGILWKLNDERQRNQERLENTRVALAATAEAYGIGRATDADMQKGIRATQQQQLQDAVLFDALVCAEAEFEAITGEKYERRERTTRVSTDVARAPKPDLLAQARALGVTVHPVAVGELGAGAPDTADVNVIS